MIMKIVKKDITTVTRGVIPHGVNCQGKMASGVAKAIKEKWPLVYDEFMKCETGAKMLGKAHEVKVGEDLYVVNCYTQEYYGRDGRQYASVDAVHEALAHVFLFAEYKNLDVHMPKIASGLGGLDWESDVKPIIEEYMSRYHVNVYVYEI